MDLIWLFYVGGMGACTLGLPTLLMVMWVMSRDRNRGA